MQCLALGPYHIPGAAYSEVLSLKTLEALGAVSFPGLGCELQAGLCLEQLSRGCCSSAGKSWLWSAVGCPCVPQAMPMAQAGTWTLSGSRQSLGTSCPLPAPLQELECQSNKAGICCSTGCSPLRPCWGHRGARAQMLSFMHACHDTNSVSLHLIMKCMSSFFFNNNKKSLLILMKYWSVGECH